MDGCHPVTTPLPPCAQFQPTSVEEHTSVSSYPYLKVIGSLTYAAMGTCSNICAAVRSLSLFAAMFSPDHINGVKHIMQYLAGCPGCSIMYTMGDSELVGYTNADWANDHINHCSFSGFMFLYSGVAVSWSSKQQSTVATSLTNAEYIAAAEASKELVWLCQLPSELCKGMHGPTRLYIDNHTADLLAWNPINHAAMKHVNIRYHFIRECIMDGSINLKLIGTNDMVADILTKALAVTKHKHFCQMLGMEMMP